MEQYDPRDFESVIAYMRQRFGIEVFREPGRMYSIFCDLSPGLEPYGNVFRRLAERGVFALSDSPRMNAKARYVMENDLLLGAERVDYFLGVLNSLYSTPPTKIIQRGECGYNVNFTLDENGVLTISGAGAIWDFELTGRYTQWQEKRETISKVEIQDGVTGIGDFAFYACTGLTSVTISHSVTYIGYGAFSACKGLANVTIPNGVTSIGYSAFRSCTSLTSVTIPDSVTTIERWAFHACTGLRSVSVPAKTKIYPGAFPDTVRIERRA
ncbi:MAG: leucine-rich repeat domain-containing protein [Oscillibacter sp.]|nr:leucine-rich repeat domain-containing protein [Oscillibacter sp.]